MEITHQEDKEMNEQQKLWNGSAGLAWVDAQALLDRMFQPFEDRLAEGVRPGCRVLDIGCGTGATTLAAARRVGKDGGCTGVDISEPMLALARRRAENEGVSARFVCADAQDHAFEPGSFDRIVSRFGVMFFADPVRAFANLRRSASPNSVLHCFSWRSPADNPFMTAAERAAAPMLPDMPPRKAGAPGQFAFADVGRVERILAESGWREIAMRPVDIECVFPETGLTTYLTRMGPLGLILQQVDEDARARIIATVRAAFEPYVQAGEVRFNAACWEMNARA